MTTNPHMEELSVGTNHIWQLHNAIFDEEAVLCLAPKYGGLSVWPLNMAEQRAEAIILAASELQEYCNGKLTDELAAQLVSDLNKWG